VSDTDSQTSLEVEDVQYIVRIKHTIKHTRNYDVMRLSHACSS